MHDINLSSSLSFFFSFVLLHAKFTYVEIFYECTHHLHKFYNGMRLMNYNKTFNNQKSQSFWMMITPLVFAFYLNIVGYLHTYFFSSPIDYMDSKKPTNQ